MDDTQDETVEPTGDGRARLLKTGEVLLEFDGESYRLRPPRLGEYRKLKAVIFDAAAEELDASESERALKVVRTGGTDDDEVMVAFMQLALSTLCTKAAPAPDEWPVWMTSGTLAGRMLKHWRSVPLDRG